MSEWVEISPGRAKCVVCGLEFPTPPGRLVCRCDYSDEWKPCEGDCPGDRLKEIFIGFGLSPCAACFDLMHDMNRWRSEGCEARIDEILERLEANAKRLNWGDWMRAGTAAALAGYSSKRQIVVEAIRRAREKSDS